MLYTLFDSIIRFVKQARPFLIWFKFTKHTIFRFNNFTINGPLLNSLSLILEFLKTSQLASISFKHS